MIEIKDVYIWCDAVQVHDDCSAYIATGGMAMHGTPGSDRSTFDPEMASEVIDVMVSPARDEISHRKFPRFIRDPSIAPIKVLGAFMSAKVGRVDHPVIAVNNLESTREQYAKLGFVVPPIGRHQEWGTANICIMFSEDYLEIRGVGDPDKFLAGLDEFLVHGEGLSGVAFNAKSATESYEAGVASGLGIVAPKHLNRRLIFDGKTLDLHFRTVMLAQDLYPGLTHANLVEHLTADELRQPGWMDHPNGVLSFGRIVGVVTDMAGAERTYQRLLGSEHVNRESDRIRLDLGEGADIELITPLEASTRGDAQPARGDAYIASATLLVRDVEKTAQLFQANGIRFRRVAQDLRVDPADACGAHLYFRQA